ncbi:hypothetical protein N656DRAFT_68155 [Canariomyces notabilis]|uniref:Uncharacterized protein n=1 Tax=Canariomyces notabilis TaxID=2074819 RepID=A0AAN6TNV2_9PEZI|nr:hypothetical protein N656DRAFT_68155 [Canariomyces arenarius]
MDQGGAARRDCRQTQVCLCPLPNREGTKKRTIIARCNPDAARLAKCDTQRAMGNRKYRSIRLPELLVCHGRLNHDRQASSLRLNENTQFFVDLLFQTVAAINVQSQPQCPPACSNRCQERVLEGNRNRNLAYAIGEPAMVKWGERRRGKKRRVKS